MNVKDLVLKYAPVVAQNFAISIYNTLLYRSRHGGDYWKWRKYYSEVKRLSKDELSREAELRLQSFIDYAVMNSKWYSKYRDAELCQFPILEKEQLLANLHEISTISESRAVVSLTGGTTGASMKVLYKHSDMQERFAILDEFRSEYGYVLGRRTAWFSGKGLVREKDLRRGICYRDDYINKIRFFSTFHISEKNFDAYWAALIQYSPEFIVGFPSSVYDLCKIALEKNLTFKGRVKVFFPTAETVLDSHREVINAVLGCILVDQYASSEGAPFILQCFHGKLHLHPLTGVFEVVDECFHPSREGEILVTSFTTAGTPLIRYRIGDRIRLADESFQCLCGSRFPVVEYIDGRSSDYVLSPSNGRVNLGNISNCTKNISGIICFQVLQVKRYEVIVKVVASDKFDSLEARRFKDALLERLGGDMAISIMKVADIPREKSGKFRIVKNLLA